jgi:hypothetical protein
LSAGFQDLNKQCLRILRCTAQALANSPGGLRFKAGTRPWLEGLSNARPMLAAGRGDATRRFRWPPVIESRSPFLGLFYSAI